MASTFHKLLLSELHMAVYQSGDADKLNDRLLCEAVTLNENLQSLGFVLKPEDLMKMAVSPSLHTFFDTLKELLPDVKAQPMYPGFPLQVMQMSEAEMKWNQFLHTFSVLGVEFLTGIKVSKSWMPDTRVLNRYEEDTTLLDAAVLELVPDEDAAITALRTLLGRRERMTDPELKLTLECAAECSAEQMQGLKVCFKENPDLLFPLLMEESDRDTALRTLRGICAHTGDVLRCAAGYLTQNRYHLRTA